MAEGPLGAAKNLIPSPLPDDHEDVSWALSTAQTTWDRGDFADALKWLRRAAESASEAEADDRALALAKVAADLTSQIDLRASAPPPPVISRPPPPQAFGPRISAPPPRASAPPPLPSRPAPPRASYPPPPPTSSAPKRSSAPPLPPRMQTGRPGLGLLGKAPPNPPRPPAPIVSSRPSAARDHGAGPTSGPRPGADLVDPPTSPVKVQDSERTMAVAPDLRTTQPGIAHDLLLAAHPSPETPLDDWPVDHTTAESPAVADPAHARRLMAEVDDAPKTRIGTPAYREEAISKSSPPVRPDVDERVQARGPGTRPMQAVRVVVWRGPDGVHIAPHGTTVSAISVEAMLVALDPSADLYAWLTNK